jgi:protein SCO1/2
MKNYNTLLFALILFYGCKNANTTAIGKNLDTSKEITTKNAVVPSGSIFNLADTFQTQKKNAIILASLAGKPTVMGMIFTNCGYACPHLTNDMKNIAAKLKGKREKVNFVQVSFDTERDNPEQLQKFSSEMGLDKDWILLHGNEQAVRTLSVLLNVQFDKDAEGNFSHSNLITVLDKNGVLVYQKEGLDADHVETVEKINELLK